MTNATKNKVKNKVFEIYSLIWSLIETLNHIDCKNEYDYSESDNIFLHSFGLWFSMDNDLIFQFLIDIPQSDVPCRIIYQRGMLREKIYLSKNDAYKVLFYCDKLGLNRVAIDVNDFMKPKNGMLFILDGKKTLDNYYIRFYDTEEKYFLKLHDSIKIKIGNEWFDGELSENSNNKLLLIWDKVNRTYFPLYDLLGKEVSISYINLI